MVQLAVALLISGALLLAPGGALACDICGRECMGACGDTRSFVTCCYNYLRKRGGGSAPLAPLAPLDPLEPPRRGPPFLPLLSALPARPPLYDD